MIRFVLSLMLFLQLLTSTTRADEAAIAAATNFVWGDIEILEAVKKSRDFLMSQPNTSQWDPKTFSVFFEQESIFVKLSQARIGELPTSNNDVSAFFELSRINYAIINFDLCSHECGVFRVTWFKQPKKIEFFLK